MHQLRSFKASMAGVAVATASAATLAVGTQTAAAAPPASPKPTGATIVGMSSILRRCDFSDQTHVSGVGIGQASAIISTAGSHQVVADVRLAAAAPDTHYDVRLIELPQPANRCQPGDPGTAVGWIDTDGAGNGNVTLQEGVLPGATAAWVFIEGPSVPYEMLAGDYYTSDFPAAI
jgi:hypothetical protein